MESSRKLNSFNDLFLSNILVNAVAPSTPIGLFLRYNFCNVSFVHRALAYWHAPSDSMSHSLRLRITRVWFVLSTEASEIVFWTVKCEYYMYNLLSVELWWSPLMISFWREVIPTNVKLLETCGWWQQFIQNSAVLHTNSSAAQPNTSFSSELCVVSDVISGTVPPRPMLGLWDKLSFFRWGMCGMRWMRLSVSRKHDRRFTPSDVLPFSCTHRDSSCAVGFLLHCT